MRDTSERRKQMFSGILSKELANVPFAIQAEYKSAAREQVMRLRCLDNGVIRLNINLSFSCERMFAGSWELSVALRAWFIVRYIRCLENAKEAEPQSLFSGLVTLEAIGDLLLGKTETGCLPNAFGKNKRLRPIDVHCAIWAMKCVLANSTLPDEAVKQCQRYIDVLITYTGMPEVEYVGAVHPCYTVVCEARRLSLLTARCAEQLEQYALFRRMPKDSADTDDAFWSAMILRMTALAKRKTLTGSAPETRCAEFYEYGIDLFSEQREASVLLDDVRLAMQQLASGVEKWNASAECGKIHYIR